MTNENIQLEAGAFLMHKALTSNEADKVIAELVSETAIVNSVDDAVDLLGNASFQGARGIIIREEQLSSAFFDLSTRIAGEILQKFSNYRMRLAIIGNFSKYSSQSLRDFIYESNKAGHIVFVPTFEEAMTMLSR